ncbi:MAG: DUF1015 family protein [Planctomycetaceae bacterium]
MVQILPFAGWRFDLSQVGALSEVTAPAISLIDESLQRTLYRQHPCNAVRLVLNREEPGDTSPDDRSKRADDFWRLWKREGILLHEHNAAFYIIETTFRFSGQERTRWSIIARLQLSESVEQDLEIPGVVRADEQRVTDQGTLRRVCHASLVPVVALLADTTGADSDPRTLSDHFEFVVRQVPPVECYGEDGVRHRMWPVTNPSLCSELQRRLACFSPYIIGGYEEYLAAKADSRLVRTSDPNDASRSVLACLIPADDSGLEFQPHLLSRPLPTAMSVQQIREQLQAEFECQFVGSEDTASDDAAELARINSEQPCVAVGTSDGGWMLVTDSLLNDVPANEWLTERINRRINAGISSGDSLTSHRLTGLSSSLAVQSRALFKAKSASLLMIEPARTVAELLKTSDVAIQLPELSVQLCPGVPTGLVFLSTQNPGGQL